MKTKPTPQQLPIQSLRINHCVGIDPDIDKSGFAIWSRKEQQHTFIKSLAFWEVLSKINEFEVGSVLFRVDAGWLNGGYFHAMPQGFTTWSPASQKAYLIKRGIDVGRNFGVGQTLVAYLRAMGHEVVEVKPVGGVQGQRLKWDAQQLKRYTGWTKQTNEDSRDAARLCFQQ